MKKLFLLLVALFCVSGICYAKGKHKPTKTTSSEQTRQIINHHIMRDSILEDVFSRIEYLVRDLDTHADSAEQIHLLVEDIQVMTTHGKYLLWLPPSTTDYQMYKMPDLECP